MTEASKFPPRVALYMGQSQERGYDGLQHGTYSALGKYRGVHTNEVEYLSLEEANHMADLRERDTWRAAAELVPEEFRELLLKGAQK